MLTGNNSITIYTDGSCHTQTRKGSWVAIILNGSEKKIISGTASGTTHQRMELTAVIKGLEYANSNISVTAAVKIITDSQYVCGLPARMEKLLLKYSSATKESATQNIDLVKQLSGLLENRTIEFIKIKAHLKKSDGENYNREADILSRKLVRDKAGK